MFDKPAHPDAVRLWPGSIPISHRYTAGLAGERFFRALAERGVFLATRCPRCSVVSCPPVAFCERCLGATEEELEVGPSATLESFTVVRIGFDGEPLAAPVVVGLTLSVRVMRESVTHSMLEVWKGWTTPAVTAAAAAPG